MSLNTVEQTLESLKALSGILENAPQFVVSIINEQLPGGKDGRDIQNVLADSFCFIAEIHGLDVHLRKVLDSSQNPTG